MDRIHGAIRGGDTIRLPDFDPSISQPSDRFALQSVGVEPNPFGGCVGQYRYQLEGEDDLLHLIVARRDNQELTEEEGQLVARFLLPEVAPGLIWLKSGKFSQHFYVGHDDLIAQDSC